LFVLIWGLATAGPAFAENWVVGADGAPMSLAQALEQARDGDSIELLPGEYRGQPVVIENRKLSLRGVGKRPVVYGEGKVMPQRAMWTVRGGEVTIENIEFRGARSLQAEGAGVRLEGGRLSVRECSFFDNEQGLLAANDAQAELAVENSVFGSAPKVVGGLHHLLNVGRIARLKVQGTRFQAGFEGHLIKSRARESVIAYNFIHDGSAGSASYEIDLPAGGLATVIGNVIGQSPRSQNRVLIAYGSEGRAWERNALYLSHNTLINYGWLPAWFLRVWRDRLPEDTEVIAINNLLVGTGLFWLGASGSFDGNRPATLGMLVDAPTYAFELPGDSVWRGSGIDPRDVRGHDLSPKAEFTWPATTRPLPPGRSSWTPGAFQK
jgi:hypothetical protein